MKLSVSNTNAPVWREITVKSELPTQLKPLEELSKNLWWVWNSEAKALFRSIDPDAWRKNGENPVMLIQELTSERIAELLADEAFMAALNHVFADFKEYMSKPMRKDVPSVSYFSSIIGRPSASITCSMGSWLKFWGS